MLEVAIVESTNAPGGLSLRVYSEAEGRLSATALKSGLKEAGFQAGDEAVIISKAEYEALLHVELVARNHGELRCECLGSAMDDALLAYERTWR